MAKNDIHQGDLVALGPDGKLIKAGQNDDTYELVLGVASGTTSLEIRQQAVSVGSVVIPWDGSSPMLAPEHGSDEWFEQWLKSKERKYRISREQRRKAVRRRLKRRGWR